MEIRFAENLRQLRETKGITQSALGELVGVNQRTISAWEKGVCEPKYEILLKLCEIFDESLENILT